MAAQDNPDGAQWDAWRRVDGIWLVQLTSESRCARWTWDPVVRRVRPHDDAARALVAPETPVEPAVSPQPAPSAAVRPAAPALTLVQQPTTTPATPVASSVPSQTTGAPVAVSVPPTPIQPAAARGRTHGTSRPAARGGAPADRAPAVTTPMVGRAASSSPEPSPVSAAPARGTRPGPGATGVSVDAVAPATPKSVVPDPVPSGPAPADPLPAPAETGLTDDAPLRKVAESDPQPQATPGDDPESDVDEATAQQPAARGRPATSGRTSERASGGRRGRKSVPAWDDIVFGARRP